MRILLMAVGIAIFLEGVVPFLSPRLFRQGLASLLQIGDRGLRAMGLTAIVAGVGAPDDALIAAVLVKLFSDRQLRVGSDVIHFLTPRMERTFAEARSLVERIDKAALSEGRAVTVPLARKVLTGK